MDELAKAAEQAQKAADENEDLLRGYWLDTQRQWQLAMQIIDRHGLNEEWRQAIASDTTDKAATTTPTAKPPRLKKMMV